MLDRPGLLDAWRLAAPTPTHQCRVRLRRGQVARVLLVRLVGLRHRLGVVELLGALLVVVCALGLA
eukprot:14511158-Alexandrium_andersonii.AAC.1